ncbi:MAG: hypothetical protein WCK55_03335 [Verrucomicrobiota bacterium]
MFFVQSAIFVMCAVGFSACSDKEEVHMAKVQARTQANEGPKKFFEQQRKQQEEMAKQASIDAAAHSVRNIPAPNIPVMSSTPHLPTSVPAAPVSVDRPPG